MERAGRTLLVLAAVVLTAAGPPPGAIGCAGCHGAMVPGGIPGIAGRPAAELQAALIGFRDGSRPATLMDRLAKGFSPDELQAIAGWWAVQK
jgi:cytochrome c553